MQPEYCKLIQEEMFSRAFDKYLKKYEMMKQVHAAIDWALGRNPLIGAPVKNDYYAFETFNVGSTPNFLVLYKYDHAKKKVYLISITTIHEED